MEQWKQTGRWAPEDGPKWDMETESGAPTLGHFGNALQVWSICQEKTTTIAAAALAFNVPTARIYEAVEDHSWMFLGGEGDDPTNDTIEHEGE